jgi:hypothetical protein
MTSKSPTRLTVTREQLTAAGRTVGLGPVQSDAMWGNLVSNAPAPASFSAAQVAYYFGAAIVLVAMGWLVAIVSSTYGSGALLTMSLLYTAIFTVGGWMFASQRDMRVPGGLLYALATVMTPVTVSAFGETFHTHLSSGANTTLPFVALFVVGVLYTQVTRIAFVSLPALIAGWFAAVSAAEWLLPGSNLTWETTSILYGIAALVTSFVMDGRSEEDYSYWGYAIGAIATFTGLTMLDKSGGAYALYAAGGIVSMLVSVVLARKVFAFAGAAAVLTWVGHLSIVLFADSVLFPIVLTLAGIGTICGGWLYARNAERIDAAILRLVPGGLRSKLPVR